MLGAVSPWAIRLKLTSVRDAGEVAGRMYAISTVGSLLGTFASSLVLIPLLGTQRTFLLLAVLCAVVAVAGVGVRWAPVPVALAALLLLPVGTIKADDDGRVIFEADTTHQYARVVELEQGERQLELNEGQAIHSLYRPETVLTDDVWDGYLVTPFAALTRTARRVAILGNGAGTTARAYAEYFPRTRSTGSRSTASCTTSASASSACATGRSSTSTRRTRGRSCAAARRLRRDLRRRLPPAVHPVLPDHPGVLLSSSATASRPAGC